MQINSGQAHSTFVPVPTLQLWVFSCCIAGKYLRILKEHVSKDLKLCEVKDPQAINDHLNYGLPTKIKYLFLWIICSGEYFEHRSSVHGFLNNILIYIIVHVQCKTDICDVIIPYFTLNPYVADATS